MMPSGWRESKLGEFFKKRSRPGLDDLPTVSVTLDRGLVLRENLDRKMETTLEAHQHLLVKKSDIAYNTMRMWQGALGLANFDCIVSPAYVVCEPKDTSAYSKFFYHLFKTPPLIKKFKDSSRGITEDRLRLYYDDFERIKVRVPSSVHEQKKIAKILDTWDEAIEKVEALRKVKEQKKTDMLENSFKEIGGKKHFKSLELLADVIPSNVDKKIYEDEKRVHLCNYVDVYKNRKITAQLNFMEATATAAEIQKFTVRRNDVIITKDSETPQDIAVPAFVAEDLKDLVCGYHLALIRCDSSQILGHYLYYYFLTNRSRYYFYTVANGATRFGLSLDSIKKCEIPIVDVTEQKKLVAVLESIEQEIELLGKYKSALQYQKQGLMQKLFTGKNRVNV